jgi:hypothetical protein
LEWVKDERIDADGKKESFSRDVQIIHGHWASPLRESFKHGCSLHDMLADHGGKPSSGHHLYVFLGPEGLELLNSLVVSEKGAEEGLRTAIRRLHEPKYDQVYVKEKWAKASKQAESRPAASEI